jgi:hypothetical protein
MVIDFRKKIDFYLGIVDNKRHASTSLEFNCNIVT